MENIRFGGRPPGAVAGETPSLTASVTVMDRADGSSFSAILCLFDTFLLDLCLTYNSNTLASSGEVNWEIMALVLVMFLQDLENDF